MSNTTEWTLSDAIIYSQTRYTTQIARNVAEKFSIRYWQKAAKVWCMNVVDFKFTGDQWLVFIPSVVGHSNVSYVPTPGHW